MDRFYKRVCSIITNISEPLLEALNISEKPTYKNLNTEQLVKAIECKKELINKLKEFKSMIAETNLSLPTEIVEEIIIDAIISSK